MHLILFVAGLLCGVSVVLGAVGAHSLNLAPDQLASWETAVRYQMFHGVALLVLAMLYDRKPGRWIAISAGLMAIGTLCFSGSIILMLLTSMHWLWPATPLGGVILMLAWLWFAIGAWYHR